MKIKMSDIAKATNVSVSTVSRALSNDDKRPVKAETAKRILETAAALGYISEADAKQQHRMALAQRPRTLSCVLASYFDTYSDDFFVQMLNGINDEANRLGYRVTQSLSVSQTSTQQIKEQIYSSESDGIILLGRFDKSMLDFLLSANDNVVYAGLNRLNTGIDEVICDAYGAFSALTRHLIQNGNKKIAYVGAMPEKRKDKSIIVNEHRYRAFTDTMKLEGMTVYPELCVDIDPGLESGYCAALQLISGTMLPDAICCANDTVAMGVVIGLHESRLKVPDDIAVVGLGMDNSDIARYSSPKLTTAYMRTNEIGHFAVKTLDDRIRGFHSVPIVTLLPYDLVIRESSVRKAHPDCEKI